MSGSGVLASLRELFSQLSPRRRRQLGPVIILMLAGALAELVSIGAILPFLALMTNPLDAAKTPLGPLFNALGVSSPLEVMTAGALIFAAAAVVAGGVRVILVWVSQRFVFGVALELSTAVYSRVLYQPYPWHAAHNSSETLGAVNQAQMVATALIAPLLQAISACVIASFILIGLLIIDPAVAAVSAIGLAGIYLVIMRRTRRMMTKNGVIIAQAQRDRVQAANEGLGAIRDVLLDQAQEVFAEKYAKIEGALRKAQAANNVVATAPRHVVEALGTVLISALALLLSLRSDGLLGALPLLGALALGAQRVLPLLQQVYQGWTAYTAGERLIADLLEMLRLPLLGLRDGDSSLPFTQELQLKDVSFQYPTATRPTLDRVSVRIAKGIKVGVIGKTGSGKSTLVDIIMGLLSPTRGSVLVDNVEVDDSNRSLWQASVAHVPQSIYLADATIIENIAFGVSIEKVDRLRAQSAAHQAKLGDVISDLPLGWDTVVGERGARLSGGQRQRIGIARALYKQSQILILDEATNALDSETEADVMDMIFNLESNRTVIIITHKPQLLVKCDVVISVDGRNVVSKTRQATVPGSWE